jgi:hypothetical protein
VDRPPILCRFLSDDSHELRPPGIADRPRESAISNHSCDIEVLDVDHLVFANQRQGLLVVIVASGARNLAVRDSNRTPSLVPVA